MSMTPSPPNQERMDRIFHALSNQTRRLLLERLSAGACAIKELAAPSSLSFQGISKHIKVLENAGLIRRDIVGRIHSCSLQPAAADEAIQWLQSYTHFWESTFDALENHIQGNLHASGSKKSET